MEVDLETENRDEGVSKSSGSGKNSDKKIDLLCQQDSEVLGSGSEAGEKIPKTVTQRFTRSKSLETDEKSNNKSVKIRSWPEKSVEKLQSGNDVGVMGSRLHLIFAYPALFTPIILSAV